MARKYEPKHKQPYADANPSAYVIMVEPLNREHTIQDVSCFIFSDSYKLKNCRDFRVETLIHEACANHFVQVYHVESASVEQAKESALKAGIPEGKIMICGELWDVNSLYDCFHFWVKRYNPKRRTYWTDSWDNLEDADSFNVGLSTQKPFVPADSEDPYAVEIPF